MQNCSNTENNFHEMMIKMSESEIKDLTRFWEDLKWYEREQAIHKAIGNAESALEPITRSAIIPNDFIKRCETSIKKLDTLRALNDKEKPSKISLKI